MRNQSLNDRILNVLHVAARPMTASEIWRALPDAVDSETVRARLAYIKNRGDVRAVPTASVAMTGPRLINAYEIVFITH